MDFFKFAARRGAEITRRELGPPHYEYVPVRWVPVNSACYLVEKDGNSLYLFYSARRALYTARKTVYRAFKQDFRAVKVSDLEEDTLIAKAAELPI